MRCARGRARAHVDGENKRLARVHDGRGPYRTSEKVHEMSSLREMAKLEFTEEVTAASGAKQISSSPRETIVLRLSL